MKKALLTVILSLILSVWISGIFRLQPSRELLGDFGDKYEFFLFQYVVHDRLAHFQYPLSHTDILRYPVGFELGHGYDGAIPTFTGALLEFIVSPPLAYNLTVVAIIWANLLCSSLFFSAIARRFQEPTMAMKVMVWAASLMYATSPYVIARLNAGHLNLAFIAGFPLLGVAVMRMVDRIRLSSLPVGFSDVAFLIGSVLVIAGGSLQYVIMLAYSLLAGVISLAVVWLLPFGGRPRIRRVLAAAWSHCSRRTVLAIGVLLLGAGIVGGYFYGPYIRGMVSGSFVYTFDFANYYRCCVAHPADLLIPNQYLGSIWKQFNASPNSVERIVTLGIMEWVLVLWFLATTKQKLTRWGLLGAGILFILLALAWIRLPYWPEGGRSVVLFSLVAFACLVAKGVKKTFLALTIVALLLLERLLYPVYQTQPFPYDEARMVRDLPGKAVLDIPVSKYNPYHSTLPYVYGKKVIDGYFHDTAENDQALSFVQNDLIERYICDAERPVPAETAYKRENFAQTVALLRSLDIHTIVIQKDPQYEKWQYDNCANVRYWWYSLAPEQLVLVDSTEGTVSQTVTLIKQPRLKTRIFFAHSGTFVLNGLFIVPGTFADTIVQLPDGTSIHYNWEPEGPGMRTPPEGAPVTVTVQGGDSIDIISQRKTTETMYVTVFYQFTANADREVTPVIQKRFSTNTLDVYTVE